MSVPELAAQLKAVGDEFRLNILRVLRNDSFGVLELCHILAAKQSGMSHHLKLLAASGWVETRREGNSIFYRRALEVGAADQALKAALFGWLDVSPLPAALAGRLATVRQERAQVSREFFSKNADKFGAQQDLIAAFSSYQETLEDLYQRAHQSGAQALVAVEVGPGEGAFLPRLAEDYQQVFALDNSAQMLARAEQTVRAEGLENIEFVLADAQSNELTDWHQRVDLLAINMVLHHIASPADCLMRLAQLLKPGAQLLLTELCPHDQTWAQTSCGDLWLGFAVDDLIHWGRQAGLLHQQKSFLALRNGFQIQMHWFIKKA